VTAFLHRVFGLPTPVALNIAIAAFAGAALVLLMAAISGLDIWMTGRQGAARVIFGASVALSLLAIPLALYVVSRETPVLNDVTTDLVHPPEFVEAARARAGDSNPLAYPAERFAALQQASYPDIKTIAIPRSSEEAFEIALQALAKLRYKTSYEALPDEEPGAPGIIEVTDKTLILGFADDVVIRVTGDDSASRIDVRSASRYGRTDFGRNADRIREILREIVGRLEASVPDPLGLPKASRKKDAKTSAIRQKARDPESEEERPRQGPSRSNARRVPGQKAPPRATDGAPAPGKSRAQSDE
jgi:hypothetical protein